MGDHEKDLILQTHRSGGGLPKKCIIHFVTGRVFLVVMTVLPGENKRQTLHNGERKNVRSYSLK